MVDRTGPDPVELLKEADRRIVASLSLFNAGVENMKVAARLLGEADPNAPLKSPIGISKSEIAAFSRKMSEALGYLNGARGGPSTGTRIRNIAIAVEAERETR